MEPVRRTRVACAAGMVDVGSGRARGRGRARAPRALVGLIAVALVGAAACSSTSTAAPGATGAPTGAPAVAPGTGQGAGSGTTGSTTGSTTGGGTTPGSAPGSPAFSRPPCTVAPVGPPVAVAVAGSASDWDVTSFDGTRIRAHWFPHPAASAQQPAPTVLMGPGWGLPGDTDVGAVGVLGAMNIASLRGAGFNVLTWDPRGFGQSDGTVTVDAADHEGRDVQRLLDWVAAQPVVQTDAAGDPRVGMVGGSYGGGIQLVTAAQDCRVDAIVPVIAWHSLTTSLFKADTFKAGWSNILTGSTRGRNIDPHVEHATQSATSTGALDPVDEAWFTARGPGDDVSRITVPTLFIQGTVDTLFTLDEAVANYRLLRDRGVPTAMLWFCGGHGMCLTDDGDPRRVSDAAVAWLRRYVKQDPSAPAVERFDTVDQHGARFIGDDLPEASTSIGATGAGTLALTADGGSGPATAPAHADLLAPIVAGITPAKAADAVNVTVRPERSALVLGAPDLSLSYSGTSPDGAKPTRVFAQLVDDTTGIVVGNQATPIPLTLDGQPHQVRVPLEMVSFSAAAGQTLTLQLVPTTVSYAQPRLGGSVTFATIEVSLPVVTGLRPG